MKPIIVHRPEIQRIPPFGEQVHHFYDRICNVLRDQNIPFKEVHKKDKELRRDERYNHIVYHTRNKSDNWLNVKMNYLNTFFYLDGEGYSGWSEIRHKKFDPDTIDINKAEAYFDTLQKRFVQPKNSKYAIPQSHDNSNIPDGCIAIFLQVFDDEVMKLARVSNEEMVRKTIEHANGRPVIIKRHPLCNDPASLKLTQDAQSWGDNVIITNCDVHGVLEKARTVVCVNSGVGFEALLHLNHVITMGRCDYHHATVLIDKDALIESVFDKPRHSPEFIKKYIYWYLTSQVIDSLADRAEMQITNQLKAANFI